MNKKINEILKEVLIEINPPKEELDFIKDFLGKFIDSLGKKLRKLKIKAEIFVGGSFAKETIIKKEKYDADIFVRFDEKYKGKDISKLIEKAIKGKGKILRIHGSRDYFKINVNPSFFIELIPVIKISKPKDAENITDLSYFHVNYIKRKLKTEKMREEVRLAKAFCHANKCYGAESYINGFSGYALELLIYHYKNFLKFVKAMSNIENKEIIDIEKKYKNKYEITMNMNGAKMTSPIVLIDPTYKERNALAALSNETFEKFKKVCKKFIKNPTKKSFETKKINLDKIKENAHKRKEEFILIKAETNKQKGDVAGTKLLKFYKHLESEIKKFFEVRESGFNYNGKKSAKYFFVIKKGRDLLFQGPSLKDKKNLARFKKRHKNSFEKKGRIYSKEKIKINVEKFIKDWKIKNKKKIKEMGITKLN